MKPPKTEIPTAQNERKQRLAQALRQNLILRKARARNVDAPSDNQVTNESDGQNNQT